MNIDRRDLLSMDPSWLQWKTCEDYLTYASAMRRNILQAWNPPLRSIVVNWHGIIPLGLILNGGIYGTKCLARMKAHSFGQCNTNKSW
jgi:hypothetical protein